MTKPATRVSNPVLPDYRPKEERVKVEGLTFNPCCVCGTPIVRGYFGRWGNGGTCSGACERVKEKLPKDFGEKGEIC